MNERGVQIIEKDGRPEYAVLPIEEYRRMVASLEDAEDCAAIDRTLGEYEAGETVSGEVVHAILEGTTPLRAWRRHRGLTLDVLAHRTGVSKGYLSRIENGRKPGALDLFRRLALVLDVTIRERQADASPIQPFDHTGKRTIGFRASGRALVPRAMRVRRGLRGDARVVEPSEDLL